MLLRNLSLTFVAICATLAVSASVSAQEQPSAASALPAPISTQAPTAYPMDAVMSKGQMGPEVADIQMKIFLLSRKQTMAKLQEEYCKSFYADQTDCHKPMSADSAADQAVKTVKDKEVADIKAADAAIPTPLIVKSLMGAPPHMRAEIFDGTKRVGLYTGDKTPDGRTVVAVTRRGITMDTGEFYPYRPGAR